MPSLWPKAEVLQLISPQLGNTGRNLTNGLALSLVADLLRCVNQGKVLYEDWLISAKKNLKWNDHCIQLFWDLLSLSISYTNTGDLGGTTFEDSGVPMLDVNEKDPIDIEYLMIFLVLHVNEGSSSSGNRSNSGSPQNSRFREDTMWPAPANADSSLPLPGSPLSLGGSSSPKSPPRRPASPLSPTSPLAKKGSHRPLGNMGSAMGNMGGGMVMNTGNYNNGDRSPGSPSGGMNMGVGAGKFKSKSKSEIQGSISLFCLHLVSCGVLH